MADLRELLAACDNVLPGRGGESETIASQLQAVIDGLNGDERPDTYGEGEYLSAFEAEVAGMFGKEAGVFMPSGTMAQQIALRVWCDRTGRHTVAMHPTAHPEFAEHLGYQYLHGLKRLQFGSPEFAATRLLTAADFEALNVLPGAALLELPCRPLGGLLNSFDELVGMRDWLAQRSVPFHLDGARIWQCQHFYQKSLAEIGALFDSVYVSFYKDVGGLGGCMLMGPSDFIDECRIWQRRHGGNLVNQAAHYASARVRLGPALSQMARWVERAREVAAVLSAHPRVRVNPDPPHVNFFQVFLEGDVESLTVRHHDLARETGTFLFPRLSAASVPGFATTELHLWERAETFDLERLPAFLDALLA